MTHEKQINWQFVEGYYNKILIPQIERINAYMSVYSYYQAYKEMQLLFAQIGDSIKYFDTKKKTQYYNKLIDKKNKLFEKISKYDTFLIKFTYRPNQRLKMTMDLLKKEVDVEIMEFYELLFTMMNKLNMLFPKKKLDTDLPIYQQ